MFFSWKKESTTDAKLKFKFAFNETQQRLDNLGNPMSVAAGNAAQTPQMHSMSAHYIELLNNKWV